MRWIVILVVLLGIPRVAEAGCKKGKLLFRVTSTPLEGGDAGVLEVRTTGKWTITGAGAASGCLSKSRLALVTKAVKVARFEARPGEMCDAVADTRLEYRGAKGHVEITVPCEGRTDRGTEVAASCALTVVRDDATDDEVAASCDVSTICEKGALLLRATITAVNGGTGGSVPAVLVLEARSKGAWSRTGDGVEIASGCLSAPRRKLLARAAGRAKFRTETPDSMCKALAQAEVVYQGAKKKQQVEHTIPCGEPLDTWTAVAGECLDALTDSVSSDEDVARRCKPSE